MDLDAVVARTLKKMAGDYELRKSFYLAAVHSSLDSFLAGFRSLVRRQYPS